MNKTKKIVIPISGMHCRSCEILVEKNLAEIPEVERSNVNHKKGEAEIYYASQKPNVREVEQAIREAGYEIGSQDRKLLFNRNINDYKDLGIALLFLVGIYVVLKNFGITNIQIGGGPNPTSLPVVFLVGITAGLSTCMALVGGLILGISARHAENHPEATAMQKFRPHLFFNAGRIVSYALLGGMLGLLGSFLQFSGTTMGILIILVGIAMLMLGLKLIGIFPRLDQGGLTLPKSISRILGIKNHEKEYSHQRSFITGALTFFLPCGFTQAMQLYAVSTGSFLRGGLIMAVFALGTVPGLLGIGGITSLIKGIFAKRFFKFAGVVVLLLAFFNISNGYTLTGWQLGSVLIAEKKNQIESDDPNVTLENGVQIVKMTEASRGYYPNKFTIKKDVPVRWVIDATAPNSCASTIMISKMNIRKSLKAGENIIEFTPTEAGKLSFSCGMGMYTGLFDVVNGKSSVADSVKNNSTVSAAPTGTCGAGSAGSALPKSGGCGGSGGGCGGSGGGCGGSGKSVTPTEGTVQNVPAADSVSTSLKANEQIINITYTYSNDIQPNTFTVKAGQPVRLIVDVKEDGAGCMSTIMVPGLYSTPQLLEKGKKIVMEFTPLKVGDYNITCAMGVPRGSIKVE